MPNSPTKRILGADHEDRDTRMTQRKEDGYGHRSCRYAGFEFRDLCQATTIIWSGV